MTPSPAALKDWNERRAHERYQAACEAYCTGVRRAIHAEALALLWEEVEETDDAWQREKAA